MWEGTYIYRQGRDVDDVDSEAVGEWRAPSDAEWEDIRANRCPWEGDADFHQENQAANLKLEASTAKIQAECEAWSFDRLIGLPPVE